MWLLLCTHSKVNENVLNLANKRIQMIARIVRNTGPICLRENFTGKPSPPQKTEKGHATAAVVVVVRPTSYLPKKDPAAGVQGETPKHTKSSFLSWKRNSVQTRHANDAKNFSFPHARWKKTNQRSKKLEKWNEPNEVALQRNKTKQDQDQMKSEKPNNCAAKWLK